MSISGILLKANLAKEESLPIFESCRFLLVLEQRC